MNCSVKFCEATLMVSCMNFIQKSSKT